MRLPLVIAAFAPILAMATPGLAQTPAAAPAKPPVQVRAEACLRNNVADAVRASSGAADAAEFLIDYLCAGPVSAAANYERNMATVAAMKGMLSDTGALSAMMGDDDQARAEAGLTAAADADADDGETAADLPGMSKWFESVSVDENTGEILVADEASNPMASMVRAQSGNLGQLYGIQRPTDLRELAGRLILDTRR